MYEIRAARLNDARALAEIHSSAWKTAYRGIVPDTILDNISADERQKRFEQALSEGREENFLIFADGKPVGLMCIGACRDEDKDDSCVKYGVLPVAEYWNKGIGSYFMDWGLNELKNRGYKKATLWVLEENLNARRFYEKLGFEHDGRAKELTIGKRLTELRYEKAIE